MRTFGCPVGSMRLRLLSPYDTFDWLCRQMTSHAIFQQSDQLGVHEVVFVRNIEANDPFAIQRAAEAFLYLVAVCLFHHHDEISPFQ